MKQSLTYQVLHQQNCEFKNTGGVSESNRADGFHPAFYDAQCDRVEISRFSNGIPAPVHIFEGLPDDWVTKRDRDGRVAAIKSSVIAGFIHNGMFFTREQASRLCAHPG